MQIRQSQKAAHTELLGANITENSLVNTESNIQTEDRRR